MASNKTYTVTRSGEELEQLKTLAAAKKLADAEGAEVYFDGKCVYRAAVEDSADGVPVAEETASEIVPEQTATKTAEAKTTERYRLKALMNVRKTPALNGEIAGTGEKGEVVEVTTVKDDWLHLVDGRFILFGAGEFAEKI